MQFKDGTSVYSFDNKQIGHLGRVILNPKTKEVTDIVVRKGFLFTDDKTVPLSLIASASPDRVSLTKDAGKLDKLQPFEETHYIPLDESESKNMGYPLDMASALYWNPPLGDWVDYPNSLGTEYLPAYRSEAYQNIPDGTLALKEGAPIYSSSDQHVGNVAQIFTQSPGNRVTHLLVSEGLVFKHKKLVPVSWIRDIQPASVHLIVGTAILEKLPEFQEAYPAQL